MSEGEPEARAELARVLKPALARKGFGVEVLAGRAGLSRGTVSAILNGRTTPRPESLAEIARVLGLEAELLLALRERAVSAKVSGGRKAAGGRPLGRPLADLDDQAAIEYLQVHRSIEAAGPVSGLLPPYVHRRHDGVVAGLVEQIRHSNAAVVLVGPSSSGKTRCLWEALTWLRQTEPGWRLWRPAGPGDLMDGLVSDRLAARTVLWLNESYEFFSSPEGERVAALLLDLLPQRARQLLVVGTLWKEQFAVLTERPDPTGPDPHRNTRAFLDGRCVLVEAEFTAEDLRALTELAPTDGRLELARRLGGSEITQFLAGTREIMDRYEAAPPGARALADAAIDARRLGYGRLLPHALLVHAAPGYLTANQWQLLPEDWKVQAFAYLARECKGVPGPLTTVRHYPGQQPPAAPASQLADFLEQVGSYERSWLCPPDQFWQAACAHAATDADRERLAMAARERGRYGHAKLLYESASQPNAYNLAITAEQAGAPEEVERRLQQAGDNPLTTDFRASQALEAGDEATAVTLLKELAELGWPDAFMELGKIHERAGHRAEAMRHYQRAAELNEPDGMQALASLYFEDGKHEQARELYERSAELGDTHAYRRLAHKYIRAGDTQAGGQYLRQAIDAGLITCFLDLIQIRKQAGDLKAVHDLRKEAIEAGEITEPMLDSEQNGDHNAAEELALEAADRGYVFPLRVLLWERLRRPDKERTADLAQQACDAGHASIVRGICEDTQEELDTQVLREAMRELDRPAEAPDPNDCCTPYVPSPPDEGPP